VGHLGQEEQDVVNSRVKYTEKYCRGEATTSREAAEIILI